MKSYKYTIKDEFGIHARPAGLLIKEAKKYQSRIIVKSGGKSAEATRLIAIMGLGIKCGNSIEVEVEGSDEAEAMAGIQDFFNKNL